MNVNDIAKKIASEHSLKKDTSKAVVESILDQIATAVSEGQEVVLANFGKFKVKPVSARTAKDPVTGKDVSIPATQKLIFSPAKRIKEIVAR